MKNILEHEKRCREMMQKFLGKAEENLLRDKGLVPAVLAVTRENLLPIGVKFGANEKIEAFKRVGNLLRKMQPDFVIMIAEVWIRTPDDTDAKPEAISICGMGNGFAVMWVKKFSRDEKGDPVIPEGSPTEWTPIEGVTIFHGLLDGVFEPPRAMGGA